MPPAALQLARRAYRGAVQFVDEQVGRILRVLRERGLMEHTLVLFTADHGDAQGYPYEFSAHVPMVVRVPELLLAGAGARGTVDSTHVVELRDVLPTFLDAAGALGSIPAGHVLDGASLLCLPGACAPARSWRPWLDLEHETNHWSALTDGRAKYVFNAFSATEQLFNLTGDPYAVVDLAPDPAHAATLALWRSRMVAQFRREGRGPAWVSPRGQLVRRTRPQLYSPNYPGASPGVHAGGGAAGGGGVVVKERRRMGSGAVAFSGIQRITTTAVGAESVCAADLDGDGDMDLV